METGKYMSASDYKKVITKMVSEIPFLYLVDLYVFGEPLLNKELPEIMSKIFKKNFVEINQLDVARMKSEKMKIKSRHKLELLTGLKILNLEQDLRIRGEK